jgi:sortase A
VLSQSSRFSERDLTRGKRWIMERRLMWVCPKSVKDESKSRSGAGQGATRNVWLWTERLLLASGLALLAVYGAARIESLIASRAALERFTAAESSVPAVNQIDAESELSRRDWTRPDFSLWDGQRARLYDERISQEPRVPLAVLHISKIHLDVPVLDGTVDLTLNHAVGRIAGTARPGEKGNIGLAGHRDGFFRGLKDVSVGDAIELEMLQGTATYKVDRIRIVQPENVSVLQPRSVPSLTLVTCYPFYFIGSAPQRYIVTASLTREMKSGTENPNDISPLSAASSPKRRSHEQGE